MKNFFAEIPGVFRADIAQNLKIFFARAFGAREITAHFGGKSGEKTPTREPVRLAKFLNVVVVELVRAILKLFDHVLLPRFQIFFARAFVLANFMWIIVRGWRDETSVREAMRLTQPCDARNYTATLKLFSQALLCGFQIFLSSRLRRSRS